MITHSSWAAILAGGDGQRLRSFTKDLTGDERPKQFCRLFGPQTLLGQTRERVALNVEPGRTVYVVTRAHEPHYRAELAGVGHWQLVEQPSNRGTTTAIAYLIARLHTLDPDGIVGLFPADHYYRDTAVLRRTVAAAYLLAHASPHAVILLGAEANRPETEYGWIEPGAPIDVARLTLGRDTQVHSVRRFCEKPSADTAKTLLAGRCLWNTLIVVGRVKAFVQMLASAVPDVWTTFEPLSHLRPRAQERDLAEWVYETLPASDFSRDVLATRPERLVVIELPEAGWTDLGQPNRVLDVIRQHGQAPARHLAAG